MSKVKIFITAILIFLFFSGILIAQGTTDNYNTIIKEFFESVDKGEIEEAVDKVYEYNPWSENIKDDIEQLKSQFIGIIKLVGEYHGYETIYMDDIANRFIVVNFMLLYERQPITVKFILYRPQSNWITYSFSFTTDLDEMLEEKSKLNYYYND